ncbi:MAG: hypothetical protein K2M77_10085, partial [Muribaculaceae bacterium]|nr:hypothetical protein [Muribaculaceae bacterium]
ISLTATPLTELALLSRQNYHPEWIFGRRSDATIRQRKRVDGAGEFAIGITLRDGRIADINIEGDFFLLSDLDSTLLDRLRGVRYSRREIECVLSDTDTSQTIAGLTTGQFIELII